MVIPALWWAIRVSGLVAYGALWMSMAFGVYTAGRGAGGLVHLPSTAELHRQWSVVALAATLVHAVASVAGPEVPPLALLVPLVSPTLRGAVTMGTLAAWALVALVASDRLRGRLSPFAWRAMHATAFAAWALGLAHALQAGTDLANTAVRAVLVASAVGLLAAFGHRVVLARAGPNAQAGRRGENGGAPRGGGAPVGGRRKDYSKPHTVTERVAEAVSDPSDATARRTWVAPEP